LQQLMQASFGLHLAYIASLLALMDTVAHHPALPQVAEAVMCMMRCERLPLACLVGHSYGTAVASRLLQAAPQRVHSLALLDPVCFGMFMPNMLRNFLYKSPSRSNLVAGGGGGQGDVRGWHVWCGTGIDYSLRYRVMEALCLPARMLRAALLNLGDTPGSKLSAGWAVLLHAILFACWTAGHATRGSISGSATRGSLPVPSRYDEPATDAATDAMLPVLVQM
jgi:pimeloyl-ACP methyl ester carboxylesterase